jgi:hypothetical protein
MKIEDDHDSEDENVFEDDHPDPGIEETEDSHGDEEDASESPESSLPDLPDLVSPAPASPDATPDEDEEFAGPETALSPQAVRCDRWVRMGSLVLDHKHWQNPRTATGLDEASIAELASSIGAETVVDARGVWAGIQEPLEVIRVQNNGDICNLVIAGQRRLTAARSLPHFNDFVLVPVWDLEPEPVTLTLELASKYLLSELLVAATRSPLSSYELSEAAQRLRACKDPDTIPPKEYTLARIGAAIGRSEGWVSKILAARDRASPTLLASWRRGDVTDEQFKDLSSDRDLESQRASTERAVAARRGGDKAGARTLAKEQKELAIQKSPSAKSHPASDPKGGKTATAAEKGKGHAGQAHEQGHAHRVRPRDQAARPPSFAVVEDLLATALKRPPTHDLVKGIILGVRWTSGLIDAADLPRQWQAYMQHLAGGAAAPAKSKSKTRR